MTSQQLKPATPWLLIVLFIIACVGAIVTGFIFYRNQKIHILENSIQELSAISDLKVRQITQWRQERINDGRFLSNNGSILRQFSDFLSDSNNTSLRKDLLSGLKSLKDSYNYQTILFVDSNLDVKLFYPEQDAVIGDYLRPLLPGILKRGEVVLTDLYSTDKISFIHLDLVVPLKEPGTKNSKAFGLLVMRVDPQDILWPLVQLWPAISKTGETLLFHREGDEIVYLNELRHLPNTELVLRKSITERKLPAVMALEGIRETYDGIDYRGVPVVAVMNKVPDSPWFMVAKVDKAEVFQTLNKRVILILALTILFILLSGFFLGFLWWDQRVRFYRSKYKTELDRLALISHFDYILKYANDIIMLIDRDFKIVEANDRALEAYQYRREELIGENIMKLRSEEAREKFEDDVKVIDDQGFSIFETIHRRKDGSIFPIEISARKIDIEGSNYYNSISRDISDRKQNEEILKDSEERFRKIFEESPFGILMSDKDFGILRVNSSFCTMLGYSEEELVGLTFINFTHPEHISGDELSLMKLVAREIPIYHTEKRYIRHDGSIILGSTTVSVVRNKNGEVQFFLAMIEDITARKMVESELEKSFSLLKATLDSTDDGILVVDTSGKIIQFNKKFTEMWRITEEVLQSKLDEDAIRFVVSQLKYPDRFVSKVNLLYSDPEAISYDLIEFNDGRFFERYSQPQKISGKTIGRVWSFRDITERKMAEDNLIAAKEKAEESDKLKTAFLHNISHEIRTPMNAILGFTALLNEPALPESDRIQYIDIIFQSGNHLLSIINDIVDLAGIESGQVKINIKEININEMLRRLSEQFSYKEKSQNITLVLKAPLPDKQAIILTDDTKLMQVISNLINNSFKFTDKGKIDFGYEKKDNFMEFFVKDTGIGISPENHSRIFERFYQVDSTASRKYTGTGLGLSICKAYVELLGGKIWLNSAEGSGTTFYFTIPLRKKGKEFSRNK
jgi:PAS domain S-box-containing protein